MSETQQFTLRLLAAPGERFPQDAFDVFAGKTVAIGRDGGSVTGTVVAAEVAEDGSEVLITWEGPPVPG